MGWIVPTIKGILIGIGSAATLGAAGTGALAAVIGGVVAVGATIAASKVMGLFEVEMPKIDTDRARQATVKSTTEPYKIIYGQTLVSGPIAFVGTANTDNKDLYYAIALAGHEVNDITDMHFDDVVIPDSEIGGGSSSGGNVTGSGIFGPKNSKTIVKINKYLGTSTQAADSDLVAAFTGWTSAHQGKGIAYIVTKWTLDEDSQETWDKYTPQNIKALVQGKKLYDPRLEYAAVSTYGQDTTNASYIAYGDNPALCLVDYLINADYGMGIAASKIDWPAVVTAANGCDASVSVPGGSQSRFTCNGVLFGTDSHRTNINKLLSSMNGMLSYVNGKYVMRAGIYEAPAISLNEDDLISGLSIKTSLERGDRFNTIKGVFIDPSQNYKSTEFPEVQLADAVTRDNGEVLDKEIALNMTNSSYMAQRISNKLIQLSDQQKVVTFPANLSAMRVAVGDRVQVSIDELSWSNKVFQCLGWTFSEEGGVNLTLREDSSTSYADPAVGDYSTITATGDITPGFRGIPSPSGLSATAGLKNVELDWVNPPNNKDFESIYVYASPNGNFSSAVKIGETDGTQFVHDFANGQDAVSPGDTRYYWVRAIKYQGTSAEARSNLEPNADPNTTVFATVGRVEWSDVSGSTNAPEDNATVGATLGIDLYDIDDTNVVLDSSVRNQSILEVEIEDIIAGNFVTGVSYVITSVGTTDFTLIGASANTVGVSFTATGAGSGTGTASSRAIVKTEANENLSIQTAVEVSVYAYTEVTALGAQYSVKIDNNGRIAGFGLSSTLPTDTTDPAFSEFYIIADKFQIVDPASTSNDPIQPFTVTSQKIRMTSNVEIDGNLLVDGTLNATKIEGDVTETFSMQYFPSPQSVAISRGVGSLSTVHEFVVPAPDNSLSKRNVLSLDIDIESKLPTSASPDLFEYAFYLERKSKGESPVLLGTASTATGVSGQRQTITISGDVTEQVGLIGSISSSDTGYNNGQVCSVWFDGTDTNIQLFQFGTPSISAGDSVYYSADDFNSAGTWVAALPIARNTFYILDDDDYRIYSTPFNYHLSSTTTATELRIRSYYDSTETTGSSYIYAIKGTISNVA